MSLTPARVDRFRATQHRLLGVRGFVVFGGEGSGSGNQSVKRHRIERGQQVHARWVGSGTLRAFQQHNRRNIFRFGVEHDQLLADDDVVLLRQWLVVGMWEDRHGALGDTWFWLLKMEQFENTCHHGARGRRVYTMLRLRNSIMDGIRRFGLHPP